jgi:two-component system, cell cycle sensor histidine kinase and response regulator CckA
MHLTDADAARLLDLSTDRLPDWTQGLVITDPVQPDNPIVYASNGFCALTGYAIEEIVGRNCRFLQGTGTDPLVVAEIAAAVRRGERIDRDIVNYRKNGTPFWNHLSIGPLDTRERGQLMVGLQFDVSFRHRRI